MTLRPIAVFLLAAIPLALATAEDVRSETSIDLYVEVDPGETSLQPGNFAVREAGVLRPILAVERVDSASLILLVENTGRSWQVLNETRSAMRAFLRHAPDVHSYALVSYGSGARVEAPLSSEVLSIAGAYAEMRQSAWNETDTFDAIARTLHAASQAPAPRAVLLIGSGRDSFSKATYAEVLHQAEASGVIIHALLTGGSLGEEAADSQRSQRGEMLLRALSAQTGGRYFCPNCEAGYSDAMKEALDALSRLYLIRYERPQTPPSGFLQLDVKAFLMDGDRRIDLPVRARKGWRIADEEPPIR